MELSEARALFSPDGKAWSLTGDETVAIDWTAIPQVSKLVVGSLDSDTPIDFSLPDRLAVRCPNLTHLHLWCADIRRLPDLSGLDLKCIDIRNAPNFSESGNWPVTLDTLVLRNCPALQSLPRIALPELVDLDVSGCTGITEHDLHRLLHDSLHLRFLDASGCTQIETLSRLPDSLEVLKLRDCTSLAGLHDTWPSSLRQLDLFGAERLRRLPDFSDSLDCVDLSYATSLQALPERRGRPRTLYLFGSGVMVPPASEHGSGPNDNIANSTAHYFDECTLTGTGTVQRCKIQVLGNGRAGKTALSLLLTGRNPSDAEKLGTTHGVKFWPWDGQATIQPGLLSDVNMHLWDFGGQEIYHNTHRLFMSKGSVFVVLWHPHQDGVQPDEENGYQDTWRPLQYWTNLIESACRPHQPHIAFVCSHESQRQEDLIARFRQQLPQIDPDENLFFIDSLSDSGEIRRLKEWLYRATGRIIRTQGQAVPAYWEIAQNLVQQWLPGEDGRARYEQLLADEFGVELERAIDENIELYPAKYRKLASVWRKGFELDAERVKRTLAFLTHSGWLYWHPDLADGRVIVDQRWALDGIYALIERREGRPIYQTIRANQGRFAARELAELEWKTEYTQEEQTLMLSFMQQCALCFELLSYADTHANETVYCSYQHLPDSDTLKLKERFQKNANGQTYNRQLISEHLSESHWQQFLVHAGSRFGRSAHYARDGLYVRLDNEIDLLVRYQSAFTIGQPWTAYQPGGSVTIEYSGQSDELSLAQSIEAYLRNRLPDTRGRLQNISKPEPVGNDNIRRRRQIFISYARNPKPADAANWALDDYTAPMEQIENYLSACNRSSNCCDEIDLIIDKERLKTGDDLKQFMKFAAKSDHVVVILSDRSVKSPYCVYEYMVMLRSMLERKTDFEEMVMPVNLNSRLYTDASYLKQCRDYWRKSEDVSIETLFGMDEDDFREEASQALNTLSTQISKTVDLRIEWMMDPEPLVRLAGKLGLPEPAQL